MGYYIKEDSKGNFLPKTGKAQALIADGAEVVDGNTFKEDMVCVVENPFSFDAAVYVDTIQWGIIKNSPDYRSKVWLIYPYAKTLSGYIKNN